MKQSARQPSSDAFSSLTKCRVRRAFDWALDIGRALDIGAIVTVKQGIEGWYEYYYFIVYIAAGVRDARAGRRARCD